MEVAERDQLQSVSGPKQARSERTLYRILEAAEELIAEKGLAGLSIPEVARRANSSVGGFYARFRDKNELLRALEERHFKHLSEHLDAVADAARWQNATAAEIVRGAVDELVDVTNFHRHMMVAFLFRSIQDPVIREDALRFRREAEERIRQLLLTQCEDFDHPDPGLAIDLGIQTAFALMQQHVLIESTRAGGRLLSDEELKREISTIFMRYVGIRDSSAPGSARCADVVVAKGKRGARAVGAAGVRRLPLKA
jgi:AcrR family transcriptional regulator